jgi:hypothetical protein
MKAPPKVSELDHCDHDQSDDRAQLSSFLSIVLDTCFRDVGRSGTCQKSRGTVPEEADLYANVTSSVEAIRRECVDGTLQANLFFPPFSLFCKTLEMRKTGVDASNSASSWHRLVHCSLDLQMRGDELLAPAVPKGKIK